MSHHDTFYQNLNDLGKAHANSYAQDPKGMLSRCTRLYFRSQKAAEKFGFIGVGCITFAEARMVEFQRRALGFKHRIGDQVTVRQFWGLYEAEIVGYGIEHSGCKAIPVYDLKTPTGNLRWAYKDQIDA
jgi:hypothetical protein